MFATFLATITRSLTKAKYFYSMICMPAAVYTKNKDDFDLGGITACRGTRVSSWYSDFITVNMSLAKTKIVDFSVSRSIAPM